jgi:hypothetical protein
MRIGRLITISFLVWPLLARAQDATVTTGDQPAPGGANVSPGPEPPRPTFMQGGGVAIGTLVLHPNFLLATGYDTNVFYQNSTDGPNGPQGSALARAAIGGTLSNAPRSEAESDEPPRIGVNVNATFTWNQYLSSDGVIRDQSDLGIGLIGSLAFNAGSTGSFYVQDGFVRAIQPPPQPENADLNRDKNLLTIGGTFAPGGGAIKAYANYVFGIDFFERSALNFANRTSHLFTLGARWQWLPKTQISAESSIGITTPADSSFKSASTPFRVAAGIATLFTPTLGAILSAGYGNGFYATGPNYSSFLLNAELRFAPLATLHTAIGYSHQFQDSVIANFFVDDNVYARAVAQLFARLLIQGQASVIFRNYQGIPMTIMGFQFCGNTTCTSTNRNDTLFHFDASVSYPIKDWLLIGASYSIFSDTTDFFVRDATTGAIDSAGFVWQEILLNGLAKF